MQTDAVCVKAAGSFVLVAPFCDTLRLEVKWLGKKMQHIEGVVTEAVVDQTIGEK